LNDSTRFSLILLSRLCNWKEALVIVKPETLIGWHRKGFKLFWKWKSQAGRPGIPENIRKLIVQMAQENPTWGQACVAAELTDNQPIAYLKLLPKNLESVLLFVVPEARRNSIWEELAFRCRCAGVELTNSSSSSTLTTANASECHRLAVTGWRTLLNRLEEALISADDRSTANDVVQLRDYVR
jgi:hypothetical protein